MCAHWADGEPVCVILGDNLFEYETHPWASCVCAATTRAMVFLKEVHDPERFGVATLEGDQVVRIAEKPRNRTVIGLSLVPIATTPTSLRSSRHSSRAPQRSEITDVNNAYLKRSGLQAHRLEGWWTDAGTFESLLRAGNLVAKSGANKPSGSSASS